MQKQKTKQKQTQNKQTKNVKLFPHLISSYKIHSRQIIIAKLCKVAFFTQTKKNMDPEFCVLFYRMEKNVLGNQFQHCYSIHAYLYLK